MGFHKATLTEEKEGFSPFVEDVPKTDKTFKT